MRLFRFLSAAALLLAFLMAQNVRADDTTFRGCLTGVKDDYVLRSVDGNVYRLHSSDDIKKHVGQMVEVKGHIQNKDRDREALEHAGAAQNAGITIPTVGIDVEHIKSLSMSCPAMPQERAESAVAPEAGASAAIAEGVNGAAVPSGVSQEDHAAQEHGYKYQHFTGCLTGTDDNYVLRADDGTLYRLHSDKDIDEHVGNRVDVRGRIDNQKREREARENANSEAVAGANIPETGINVEDIKTMARGCSATTGENGAFDRHEGVQSAAIPNAQERGATNYTDNHRFTGCLTGTEDNYLLRADDGTLYRLHSDKDIDEHVGDRVLVLGSIDNQDREREARSAASSEAAAGVTVPKTSINVEDLKSISKGCSTLPQR